MHIWGSRRAWCLLPVLFGLIIQKSNDVHSPRSSGTDWVDRHHFEDLHRWCKSPSRSNSIYTIQYVSEYLADSAFKGNRLLDAYTNQNGLTWSIHRYTNERDVTTSQNQRIYYVGNLNMEKNIIPVKAA